ncbi:MAG: hypothetical protein H6713_31410 [Myxococcales bacterium]|nr:hypothetical protein [Myxococcales bacterium]MCB9754469.1 hypothetical protein [Myxococcales bacterium]
MQTTRIPFHILVGLGLTVGADACGGVSACLSMAPTDSSTASSTDTTEGVSSTSAGTSAGTSGSSATTDISTGPCLGAPYTTEDPPATSSESDTGTGSTSDTTATTGETDTGTTGDSTTTGPCLAPMPTGDVLPDDPLAPPRAEELEEPGRRAVIERVLSRDDLPADVLARLRTRTLRDD